MEKFDLFRDIVERTGGDIYIGVVGPVRAGKSTFVKKFMELMVIPNIPDSNERLRAKDELPQSGAGRTITTAEPKFIPSEAVEITIKDNIKFRVRLVDNVGYSVRGALGYEDENGPRMVTTPWFEKEIPFQEAAEIGTRKVIEEHSTLGLVVTTDGSVTEIPRENYVPAEERIVEELKSIGKPFVIVLNTAQPYDEKTKNIKEILESRYDVPVLPVDCANMDVEDIYKILEEVLYEFPIMEINISIPDWIQVLEKEHWLRQKFEEAIKDTVKDIKRLRDMEKTLEVSKIYDFIEKVQLKEMNLGSGVAEVLMDVSKDLFYQVLSEFSDMTIKGEKDLLQIMGELTEAKKAYDKVAKALEDVQKVGYGIVPPQLDEMTLEEPEIIRQGGRFGVKLKAVAPSIHMIRTDINAEVSPIIGTERQSEELINYLMSEFESDPSKLWETNLFGKSLNDLVREGIQNKLLNMPESAQEKIQETLQRIVNEGSGGLICIIL
ncbi:morphogenetic stage IV sporulation protein [Tepidanaerobacter acetatoxydans Re1]|uniref:Stage IV sporulation protein A n=1 Tax=Tepidanaerobacter acetatoxydans (strain DSM 21804 / JCM 16047 / Re1) TaxID=1209989 RepID=F4LT38_TEPAE|nr:stage IV sporulation protein A [Tepidanaerobacter acetatoxydans]AEE91307.1 stage IV sporulation protein A [Tepidanaerobacter acetatoxydans Re1]CCP25995.1 morphogenetic stage IV sporulation protein [Tepidanaerobacter acetatoxydans Re1]